MTTDTRPLIATGFNAELDIFCVSDEWWTREMCDDAGVTYQHFVLNHQDNFYIEPDGTLLLTSWQERNVEGHVADLIRSPRGAADLSPLFDHLNERTTH